MAKHNKESSVVGINLAYIFYNSNIVTKYALLLGENLVK